MSEYMDETGLYEGELLDGVPHGWGVKYYNTGLIFTGYWENGIKHGPGVINFEGKDFELLFDKGKVIKKIDIPSMFLHTGLADNMVEAITSYTNFIFDGKHYKEVNRSKKTFEDNLGQLSISGPGKFEIAPGIIIEAENVNGNICGNGKVTKNGTLIYEGEIDKCIPNGQGTAYSSMGIIYQGEFKENLYHGNGVFIHFFGTISGTFYEGLPHGEIQVDLAIFTYKGEVNKGKYHGYGQLKCDDFCYNGKFNNGFIENYEQVEFYKGNKYRSIEDIENAFDCIEKFNYGFGEKLSEIVSIEDRKSPMKCEIDNNEKETPNPFLEKHFENPIVKENPFLEKHFENPIVKENPFLEKHFENQIVKKNPIKTTFKVRGKNFKEYELLFAPQKFSFIVSLNLLEGIYVGEYYQNAIHGKGNFKFGNGDEYFGLWNNNKIQGFGTYYYNNSSIYMGFFENNLKHGKGKLILADGVEIEGVWENDVLQGQGIIKNKFCVYLVIWNRGKIMQTGKIYEKNKLHYFITSYKSI
ncbi:hypothetical protein SteCoe_21052 [Stentor coeruleus]|uniref:MORN repeat protein n=1 Tax=Stentor coeruleus TaxID=5963 RepID=A0A1R2BQI3_9CILI|nr:hypothetical protein SteCoe_21052 [Stentor coeruleus]